MIHRGRHRSDGLILQPATIGEAAAQSRVLHLWSNGSRLLALPEGHWLLLFSAPMDLDSTAAGGNLVTKTGAGLTAAPGLKAAEGELAYWDRSALRQVRLSALRNLDPSEWIDLGVTIRSVDPLAATKALTVEELTPPPPELDLRKKARIGTLSKRASRFVADAESANSTARRTARDRKLGARGGQSSAAKGNSTLAKLALRSPLRHEIGRRHAKYLDELTQQFSRGELHEALRHAIPLGGLGNGALTLRVPGRRDSLSLSNIRSSGRTVPLGPTIQQHLQTLYRRAAEELEASDRIDEAAFVLAELLNSPQECVALLERHRRYLAAATLAENRQLDPTLTVRLWWLAGDRSRAMELARKSNAYQSVLKHLENTDPDGAHQFRLLWVDELERSSNIHGAISVGWPDPQIRPLLVNAIQRGIDAQDQWSLGIHTYRVALHPSSSNRAAFFAAMKDESVSPAALRFMADALAEAESSDQVVDREVCTTALRALVSLPQRTSQRTFASAFKTIRNRADPILAADLPSAPASPHDLGPVEIPQRPRGVRATHDLVPLTDGRALVALGEAGVRLVTYAGKTVAEWSTPCHHLVPADHGKTVILLTDRETVVEAHILDLTTRKIRYYGPVRTWRWAKSFDGTSWAALDERGVAFYDMLSESPKVTWRELEPGWVCHELVRSPDSLAAVVTIPADGVFTTGRFQLWRWVLPGMRLDQRHSIKPEEYATRSHLLSDATLIWERESVAPLEPVATTASGQRSSRSLGSVIEVQTSGAVLAVLTNERAIEITQDLSTGPVARWNGIEENWGFRSQGFLLAAWTESGNIAVVDTDSRTLLALFPLT